MQKTGELFILNRYAGVVTGSESQYASQALPVDLAQVPQSAQLHLTDNDNSATRPLAAALAATSDLWTRMTRLGTRAWPSSIPTEAPSCR